MLPLVSGTTANHEAEAAGVQSITNMEATLPTETSIKNLHD